MEGEDFQSSEILLEIAREEYQNEFSRTSVIDTKVGITLPIVATYFFLVLQYESVRSIFAAQIDTRNVTSLLYSVLCPFIYIAAVLCAGVALIFLFRAIITQTYKKVDLKWFNDKKTMSLPREYFSAAMVTYFIQALEHNSSTNSIRVRLYKRGLIFALISLGFFVAYIFFVK